MVNSAEYPHGYFADPRTGKPIRGRVLLRLNHLPGTKLPGICGWIFWWVRIAWYETLDDLLYVTVDGEKVRVRHGFKFNGGSIPWCFRWLYAADDPDCLPGFCVHDMLCESHRFDSATTHRILRDACLANGARRSQAKVIYWAVSRFGPQFCAEEHA